VPRASCSQNQHFMALSSSEKQVLDSRVIQFTYANSVKRTESCQGRTAKREPPAARPEQSANPFWPRFRQQPRGL